MSALHRLHITKNNKGKTMPILPTEHINMSRHSGDHTYDPILFNELIIAVKRQADLYESINSLQTYIDKGLLTELPDFIATMGNMYNIGKTHSLPIEAYEELLTFINKHTKGR